MPMHAEKRVLPYSRERLFDLVIDVGSYPEFLPWCVATRVRRDEPGLLVADMMIGFKMFRETFTSRVNHQRPERIDVAYENGPFKYLKNHWVFEPTGENATEIDFYVEFEFRSKILEKAIGGVFNEAVQRMISAFETRARKLYG